MRYLLLVVVILFPSFLPAQKINFEGIPWHSSRESVDQTMSIEGYRTKFDTPLAIEYTRTDGGVYREVIMNFMEHGKVTGRLAGVDVSFRMSVGDYPKEAEAVEKMFRVKYGAPSCSRLISNATMTVWVRPTGVIIMSYMPYTKLFFSMMPPDKEDVCQELSQLTAKDIGQN